CAWGVSQLVGHRHHRAAARQLAKGSELPETQIHIATLNQIAHFLSLVLIVSCGDDGRTPVIPCAAWATACETTIPLHFRPGGQTDDLGSAVVPADLLHRATFGTGRRRSTTVRRTVLHERFRTGVWLVTRS